MFMKKSNARTTTYFKGVHGKVADWLTSAVTSETARSSEIERDPLSTTIPGCTGTSVRLRWVDLYSVQRWDLNWVMYYGGQQWLHSRLSKVPILGFSGGHVADFWIFPLFA
ncbi:hypothetical protein CROQUDRAFT_99844 [Cronartium quercuum f. sp. fusiforme G11]|uniref:Uncharacterized protein n=1 Tax=Cronartium quercuum f. sp. fusiforme G11 TaxID=708437 RepID=A0A9P6N6T3_9BASI|nr:hypothetical protein CROQUDRAFT_99844 [Cronartium quercuum f. sp. fusiforme G11]